MTEYDLIDRLNHRPTRARINYRQPRRSCPAVLAARPRRPPRRAHELGVAFQRLQNCGGIAGAFAGRQSLQVFENLSEKKMKKYIHKKIGT